MSLLLSAAILEGILFFALPVFYPLFAQTKRTDTRLAAATPKSDVFMQAFYWNSTPGGIWWDSLAALAPRLASAGFSAVWLPPPTKGASGSYSMGYDLYDHYDFGDYNQEGTIPTRFGTRQELVNAIAAYHANGMQVFADAVMGHMNGGERRVPYDCWPSSPPYPPADSGWIIFNYPNGSGRFRKDATFFYPNQQTCDVNPPYHGPTDPAYWFGERLANAQTKVKDSLIVWGQYLRKVLGFDGFRIDEVKAIDPIFVGPWLQTADSGGYAVAEDYDGVGGIQNWLYWCKVFGGNPSMFDFPLRFSLQSMCNTTDGSYDMTQLDYAGLVNNGTSGYNVATFVENHDLDRIGWDGSIDAGHNPIIYDKDMAYALIMFSEGRPCVWFRDYFIYGLEGTIDSLIWIRRNFLGGSTTLRGGLNPYYIRQDGSTDQGSLASDIYVARRNGYGSQPGGYLVLNDNSSQWIDVWVDTELPIGSVYRDYTGRDADKTVVGPAPGGTKNRVKLWAPLRSYTIYVADTTQHLNIPPYVDGIPPQIAYTNTLFQYQTISGDPNHDSLTYSLLGNPSWLSISSTGLISGTPASANPPTANVTVVVVDAGGDTATTAFTLTIVSHPIIDGSFEGTGVWGPPVGLADTLPGWDSAQVEQLYVTSDSTYYYFGAKVKALAWMNWAFLINTKPGGGSNESWSRSIIYSHPNLPDYILRGTFGGYAEFHTWNGFGWNGVGQGLAATEFGENLTSADTLREGWVEGRLPRSAIGNPTVLAVQCYLTGNVNSQATFDACPNDQNTTAWSGITTRLHYYTIVGPKGITQCNLQYPSAVSIPVGGSVTVYARGFGVGVTDSAGQGPGVQAWIGWNSSNTNPATWTNWTGATYNVDANGYDEYQAPLGSGLPPGTYYYASRFQYNGGNFVYGGTSPAGGGVWDSTGNKSGVLTVVGPPATPALFSPPDGSVNQPAMIVLRWNAIANGATYRLQVSPDSLFSTIVFDDSAITGTARQVGPLANNTRHFWRVRAKNIAGTSSFSLPWSFTVNEVVNHYTVNALWNMISLPMEVDDPRAAAIFPTASSRLFLFGASGSYLAVDTIRHGVGYWLKFTEADSIAVTGFSVSLDTVRLSAGWNMIGSIDTPLSTGAVGQVPPGILRTGFFGYDNGYVLSTTIQPSKAYWVKSDSAGWLILSSDSQRAIPRQQKRGEGLERMSTLVIEDAAGHRQALYFGALGRSVLNPEQFEMPPAPPPEVFDVRYATERLLELVDPKRDSDLPLRVSAAVYPIRVHCEIADTSLAPSISVGAAAYPLTGGRAVEIVKQAANIVFHLRGPLPTAFALEQNYPNPFNPSTHISYALPVKSHVVLAVYDILGQVVETLVDGDQDAGVQSAAWNPDRAPSGVYFYRIQATPLGGGVKTPSAFDQVRKMILLR